MNSTSGEAARKIASIDRSGRSNNTVARYPFSRRHPGINGSTFASDGMVMRLQNSTRRVATAGAAVRSGARVLRQFQDAFSVETRLAILDAKFERRVIFCLQLDRNE